MSRLRTAFRCGDCGAGAPKWVGRCPVCGAWNTFLEEFESRGPQQAASAFDGRPLPIAEIDSEVSDARPTGMGELDRVLGGGLVPGSVTLVGGEPGIGKSTLVLQAVSALAGRGARCLLATAEESAQQVRARASRMGALPPSLWLVAEAQLPRLFAHVDDVEPSWLAVDSIQTIVDPELAGGPGSVSQVRECAQRLVQLARQRAMATLVVGQVTKEGTLSGPRALEHVVDTVLSFEGDRHHAVRLLRAVKHRFGSTSELGLFEMSDDGLRGVPDAGRRFLSDRRTGVPGSAVAVTIDGRRPLVVELQALTTRTSLASPRRCGQGVDGGRVSLLAAVLERRLGLPLARTDVYASAVGGARVAEPGADLPLALAMASAVVGRALPPDLLACAEIGLAGELRQVAHTGRRLAEAVRLGFRRAIVAPSAPESPPGMTLVRAATLAEAVVAGGLPVSRRTQPV